MKIIIQYLLFNIVIIYLIISLLIFDIANSEFIQIDWLYNVNKFFNFYSYSFYSILFFIFGKLVYLIPTNLIIINFSALIQKLIFNRISFCILYNQIIGGICLVVTSCSLLSLQENINNIHPEGILGKFILNTIFFNFQSFYIIFILITLWILSFILLTYIIWIFNLIYIKSLFFFFKNKNKIFNYTQKIQKYNSLKFNNNLYFKCKEYIKIVFPKNKINQKKCRELNFLKKHCKNILNNKNKFLIEQKLAVLKKQLLYLIKIIRKIKITKNIEKCYKKIFNLNNIYKFVFQIKRIKKNKNSSIKIDKEYYSIFSRKKKSTSILSRYKSDKLLEYKLKNLVFKRNFLSLINQHSLNFLHKKNKTFDIMQAILIELKFLEYNIKSKVVNIFVGPILTTFKVYLLIKTKLYKNLNISQDLAKSLSVSAVRTVKNTIDKRYIEIEVPNKNRKEIYLNELLNSKKFINSKLFLNIILGIDSLGNPYFINLQNISNLLLAGSSGSGKSVCINTIITNIIYSYTPKEVGFIIIDTKTLGLLLFDGMPHLLNKIVTNINEACNVLLWCLEETERRYQLLFELNLNKNKNILVNNKFNFYKKYKNIIIVIEEFYDLIEVLGKEFEKLIVKLIKKIKYLGIHLIITTRKSSIEIVSKFIKNNINFRIAFKVQSEIDSINIINQTGAESLIGAGDMLYLSSQSLTPIRIHGAKMENKEIEKLVKKLKEIKNPDIKYCDYIKSCQV